MMDTAKADEPHITGLQLLVLGVLVFGITLGAKLTVCKPNPSRDDGDRQVSAPKWYEGGTLHKATMGEWMAAAPRNQLATAADFVASMAKVNDETISSIDEMKTAAISLVTCMKTSVEGLPMDHQPASQIAAACKVMMR